MREIVLDTETTGLDPFSGHRIIEIGCIELKNKVKTGNFFHYYINPEREVPVEAYRIHGISTDFLLDKPKFIEIVDDFLDFIKDSPLVIHNAKFDMKFLNAELKLINKPLLKISNTVDSLLLAREKFPGSPATLDALCKRFNIDLSKRTKHGALLDSELLADVYLELMGGAQTTINFTNDILSNNSDLTNIQKKNIREPRKLSPSEEEIKEHKKLVDSFKNSLWT